MKTKPNQHNSLLKYGISESVRTFDSSRPTVIDSNHEPCGTVVRHWLVMYLYLTCEGLSFTEDGAGVIEMRYFHWLSDPPCLHMLDRHHTRDTVWWRKHVQRIQQVSRTTLPDSVSVSLDCQHVTNTDFFTWWCGPCFPRHCCPLVTTHTASFYAECP